jgi:hypothetical protein
MKSIVAVHAIKAYGGVQVYLHPFLTLVQDGGEWPSSRLAHFTVGKEPLYQLKSRLGGPQSQSGHFG